MSQDALVAALAAPASYPHRPARVEHVQTHISHVFLAGPYVYKLKKAVRFPFLDFTTLAQRRAACADELRLNRRLSPAVYLDVLPVVRRADGRHVLGGEGEAVDVVLRMRRLPADRMLPALLARDAVDAAMLERLAALVADFHARAPTGPAVAAHAAPAALAQRWDDAIAALAPAAGTTVAAEEHAVLAQFGREFVARHAARLAARQQGGHVRDGHGDLHAEHVCFVAEPGPDEDGVPGLAPGIYVFDCIEFSEALRCNDVASEIAFLAMDLERRGRRDLADAFVAAYVAATGDRAIPGLLPYYVSARALVRAMVACLTSGEDEVPAAERAAAAARARAYLALAIRAAWRADGPMLLACTGLSGTGKSVLAAALGEALGATVLRSDVIRKADGAGAPDYAPAARAAVYARLFAAAERALAAGESVIADATFLRRADRDGLARVAARRRVPHCFLECRADEATVRARLDARGPDDVSDARWDTYRAQRAAREPFGADEAVAAIDTAGTPAAARAAALWTCFARRWGDGGA